jgi:hypothetical protein
MLRQRMSALLIAAAAVLAVPAAAQAQHPSLNGTYTFNAAASDNVNAAIDKAVARMNFVTRPIARGRLRRTNQPYNRITLNLTGSNVSIVTDTRAPIATTDNGTAIKWKREDGEEFNVSTRWEGHKLLQTFSAEDGSRENRYSVGNEGRTLTLEVTVRSPRLQEPVTYRLVYDKVS